jgi:hypothetical protein
MAKRKSVDKVSKLGGEILVSAPSQTRSFGKPKAIPVQVLSENVNVFIAQIGTVLDNAPSNVKQFRLDEISFTVEVTASGELSIMGTGVGAEAKGGMTFTFKKA